ncbi:MAG: hypothetical protein WBK22_00870 [Halanaerobiales bacterium]
MENKTIFAISIIISSFLLLLNIFSWTYLGAILEILTSHYIFNIYLIYILIMAVSFVMMVIGIFRGKSKTIIPFVINLLTLIILVPSKNVALKCNIEKNHEQRSKIVYKIIKEELIPDKNGTIELPFWYKQLSKGGKVFVEKNGGLKVLFITFRGVLDNFSGLVYISDNKEPQKGLFGADIREVVKVKEYWYWIASW